METGAEAVRLLESADGRPDSRHLLFLDADLGESASGAGPLTEPVRAGTADMTIAIFRNVLRRGGFGFVTGAAGAGIERATGWRPAQPLNGQRCLTRAAFTAALPLARGWGVETAMTIDLLRRGLRVTEVEVPLSHRATGKDLAIPAAPAERSCATSASRSPVGASCPRGRAARCDHELMTHRYSYLGPRGTFTEAAVRALAARDAPDGRPPSQPDALPCPSIQATLEAVRAGQAEQGVVPIESSVEGAVTATLDELAVGTELVICAEVLIPVEFALLARPGSDLASIKRVGGHPVAQPQCRRWLAANLPHAEWLPAASNSDAARQVAEGALDAALAGVFAAELYGLVALATGVHDRDDAVTRFVSVRLPGRA